MLAFVVAVLTVPASPQSSELPRRLRYASSVSFFQGQCNYWTGDVMLDPGGFRDDLRKRFDPSRGMTVYHSAEVPSKCVAKAQKLAKQAGIHEVDAKVGMINMGPP